MSKFGQITEYEESAQQFRVKYFLQNMQSIDFGNCGVPTKLQDFLLRDKKGIEDVFLTRDGLYILPKSKQSAKYLYDVCVGQKDQWGDYPDSLADEITWEKFGDRYYLCLWWD